MRAIPPDERPAWTAAKWIPLAEDVAIAAGVEARFRSEAAAGTLADGSPAGNVRWLRLMPLAQVEARSVRLFAQPIVATAPRVRRPGPSDATGFDLLQGFAELGVAVGRTAVTLRAGRSLVVLGSERLVGTRYGANVPRAFEGIHVEARRAGLGLRAMHLRPVTAGPRDFDDRATPGHALDALQLSAARLPVAGLVTGLDLYVLLDRRRDRGTKRVTLGMRAHGRHGRWAWNWELMAQRGRAGERRVGAWSIASETEYRAGPATLRLRADLASGDRDGGDSRLETFDPLFPKGQYFGELSPIGPRNLINLHPGVTFAAGKGVTLGAAYLTYWRHRLTDGAYDLAGAPLAPPGRSRARHVGSQAEVTAEWQPHPLLTIALSYSQFVRGAFLRDHAPAQGRPRRLEMFGVEGRFRL